MIPVSILPLDSFKSEISSGPSRRFGASLFRNIAHHNKDIPCLGHPPTVEGTTWYSPPDVISVQSLVRLGFEARAVSSKGDARVMSNPSLSDCTRNDY